MQGRRIVRVFIAFKIPIQGWRFIQPDIFNFLGSPPLAFRKIPTARHNSLHPSPLSNQMYLPNWAWMGFEWYRESFYAESLAVIVVDRRYNLLVIRCVHNQVCTNTIMTCTTTLFSQHRNFVMFVIDDTCYLYVTIVWTFCVLS